MNGSTLERGLEAAHSGTESFSRRCLSRPKNSGGWSHIPLELIESAKGFLKPCMGLNPPAKGLWCHITGTDLVRDKAADNGLF